MASSTGLKKFMKSVTADQLTGFFVNIMMFFPAISDRTVEFPAVFADFRSVAKALLVNENTKKKNRLRLVNL